ncbi:serine/threonine protein kinase [Domibacillus epiphyticus]|uniref:Protein kinase domain-containing protein n=1 Tax=Domibacillus epiphyticus TaxID=1714355 RepID=A0A1V2A652_9BACI|nr:protein kinase [Domibacillus epiphyticus]OMP66342.1 hypothetical protein BTO28_12845 [Domibacillus epiphyticus]
MKNIFSELLERPLQNNKLIKNRYIIHQFIGKGSSGLAYKATDFKTGQSVIIKQLRKRKRNDLHGIESFQREADFLKKLNHPSIPSYLDAFMDEHHRFLVMEYIEAPNFEELIFHQKKEYNERETFSVLLNILHVVKYFHDQKIVHRDLRIPNILWDGIRPYVIDFGLARSLDEQNAVLPKKEKENMLFREISVQSDFFALGHFVLFLLYSQFEPQSKKEKSWEEELDLSAAAKKMIRRMLQLDHSYESADELMIDVESFFFTDKGTSVLVH